MNITDDDAHDYDDNDIDKEIGYSCVMISTIIFVVSANNYTCVSMTKLLSSNL